MAVRTYCKYRLFCITQGKYVVTDYRLSAPTVCPEFMTDTINPSSITIIDQFTQETVNVAHNSVGTQGQWQAVGFTVNAAVGYSSTTITLPPYPVKLSNLKILSGTDNVGDIVSIYSAPDTAAGTLSVAANSGDTTITLDSSALVNLLVGYPVSLNGTAVGVIVAINNTTFVITLSQALSTGYPLGANLTYSIPKVTNLFLASDGHLTLGEDEFSPAVLPANFTLRVDYTNNGSVVRNLGLLFSVMY